MDDQVIIRLLISAGSLVLGAACLVYAVWARNGGSTRAREWMGDAFGGRLRDERWAVLGAPSFGLLCLCFGASILPVVGLWLALIAIPVGVLAFGLLFLSAMHFIPLPDLVYPRWARPLRERNRRAEQGWKKEIRRRSGR